MQFNSQFRQPELGIWNNPYCINCGACCYDLRRGLCEHQEISQGKSYCKIHDKPERERRCQGWFCSNLTDSTDLISPEQQRAMRIRFQRIAKALGTSPARIVP